MRRRPTKALFYNFLVLFSTLLCMYCFFVFDYFEASGSDVVDDIQLVSACGVAISVLVFFSLSVGNDLPRHTSLTYMEAVPGVFLFNFERANTEKTFPTAPHKALAPRS